MSLTSYSGRNPRLPREGSDIFFLRWREQGKAISVFLLHVRNVSDGFEKVSDDLGKVSHGLRKVSDGLEKVSDGAGKVSDGLG